MIYETLQILKEQLEKYFDEVGLNVSLILDNVALWESGSKDADKLDGKVILTLLNIEEEVTMKNVTATRVVNNKTEYRNPPVNLNIYLLVSANCNSYDYSLRSVSRTLEFFQGKRIFTSSNTIYNRANVSFDVLDYFNLLLISTRPDLKWSIIFGELWEAGSCRRFCTKSRFYRSTGIKNYRPAK